MSMDVQANIDRFNGFADCYDDVRPRPPDVLVDMLTQMAGVEGPDLVIDLGSGTGLSTRIWAGRARQVIGVEPNPDMRTEAHRQTPAEMVSISYREGTSTRTSLSDGCADIVTAVQALHWMEPEGTFAEVVRILRPGGIFAAVDCDWPPAVHPNLDAAYARMHERIELLQKQTGVYDSVTRWPKREHLERMRESGQFRWIREIHAHQTDSGDAARYLRLVHSQGGVVALLRRGCTEEDLGLDELRAAAERAMGNRTMNWFYSYRVRLGAK